MCGTVVGERWRMSRPTLGKRWRGESKKSPAEGPYYLLVITAEKDVANSRSRPVASLWGFVPC